MKQVTIFEFTVWFEGNEDDKHQRRYVAAETEGEAIEKIEAYSKSLKEQGFAKLLFSSCPLVEIEGVIL